MIFQEQLNDLPDRYSRNYEDCQPVAGKMQQKISERETIQIFSVEELRRKLFQSEQKVRSKNGLIYSCHKKYTEEKWYHEIGQSVFFQTKDA